jgi:hypothetical protein
MSSLFSRLLPPRNFHVLGEFEDNLSVDADGDEETPRQTSKVSKPISVANNRRGVRCDLCRYIEFAASDFIFLAKSNLLVSFLGTTKVLLGVGNKPMILMIYFAR